MQPYSEDPRFEWDLDHDGVFERDTGGDGSTEHVFTESGARLIGFRVSVAAGPEYGGRAVTTHVVYVFVGTGEPTRYDSSYYPDDPPPTIPDEQPWPVEPAGEQPQPIPETVPPDPDDEQGPTPDAPVNPRAPDAPPASGTPAMPFAWLPDAPVDLGRPPVATRGARLSLTAPAATRASRLARRGVAVAVASDSRAILTLTLRDSRGRAIGRRSGIPIPAGSRRPILMRLTPAARRRYRRLAGTVATLFVNGAGATVSQPLALMR